MNKPSNFTNFVDALTHELVAMSDEQVLEGHDVSALQADAQSLLKTARAEAGRRRLGAAKASVTALRNRSAQPSRDAVVSIEEARRFIAQAQNDPRYTLAARKLGEMPDDEVLRLYRQMKHLERLENPDGDGDA